MSEEELKELMKKDGLFEYRIIGRYDRCDAVPYDTLREWFNEAKKDIKPIEFQEVVDSSSTVFNMPIAILVDMNTLRKLNEAIKKWFGDSS